VFRNTFLSINDIFLNYIYINKIIYYTIVLGSRIGYKLIDQKRSKPPVGYETLTYLASFLIKVNNIET